MLEDGFADELNEIIKNCPKSRQTMLFSATMTENIDELIRLSLNRPIRLMVDPAKSMSAKLTQEFIRVREHREDFRAAMLLVLCKQIFHHRVIIFFRSKAAAHEMKIIFGLFELRATELHGNLSQEQVCIANILKTRNENSLYRLFHKIFFLTEQIAFGSPRSI